MVIFVTWIVPNYYRVLNSIKIEAIENNDDKVPKKKNKQAVDGKEDTSYTVKAN